MIKVGLLISLIGLVLVGFASKKVGGFNQYLNRVQYGRPRRGIGWFQQILNLGLLITVLGIVVKLLS